MRGSSVRRPPTTEVPPPTGTTATRCSPAIASTRITSSWLPGRTTRSGTFRDGDSFVVIPTIVNGELLSDGDAFDRYRKTGEHWAKTDTREAGDAVARRIHDRHEGRDRAKWNEYILGHWDEMSGKVTSDKWLRAEHTRRVSREAAVRANSGANAVMSAVSPVRRDDKGGWSPYDNAEAAIAKALPFIKEHEKFVGKAYWDKEGGKWTVGHGHTRIRDAKTGKMRNVTGTQTTSYVEQGEDRTAVSEPTVTIGMRCPAPGAAVDRCHLTMIGTVVIP